MDYRHELKFMVSSADLELIRARICHIAKPDAHQKDPNGYLITSLYFDDLNDTCLKENLDGVDLRHKYRLRIYGHSADLIKLERKSKVRGMTAKQASSVTEEECRQMMRGSFPWLKNDDPTLKKQLLCQMKLAGMRPKCIVQYQREAFIYPTGNVRITFDKNICGCADPQAFLDSRLRSTPLLDTDIHILEVKYDNLLPRYLYDALDTDHLRQTSFSKYGYARTTLG